MEVYEKETGKSVTETPVSFSDFPIKLNMDGYVKETKKFLNKITEFASNPGTQLQNTLSLAVDIIFALIYWPLLAISIFFVYVIRFTLDCAFSLSNSKGHKYKLVSGADSLFGYKTENGSSIIHSAMIVHGIPNYDEILSRYENIIFKFKGNSSKKNNMENIYVKLKHILTYKFGFYCWRDASEEFNIRKHVKLYSDELNNNNNNEGDTVSETMLMDILSKFVSEDLPDSRPQWEHVIIPKFKFDHEPESLTPQHFVCIFRIHHAYADGGSLGIFMDTVMADKPLKFAINPYKPFPGLTKWLNILSYVNMILKGPADFVRTMKSAFYDDSIFFVKSYSSKKVIAWSDPIDMNILRDIKKTSGASVPSILLSSITAALQNQHVKLFTLNNNNAETNDNNNTNKEITSLFDTIPKTINIGTMSVMLPYESPHLQNHFTTFTLNCPLVENCSVDRLTKTNITCRLSGYSSEPRYNYFVMGLLGNCPKFVQDFFLEIAGTPLIFSNVPGVVEPMKVFGGTLADTGVWLPHIRAYGMAVATYSYCGKLRMCLTADSTILTSSLQAKEFLKYACGELDKLANSYENCKKCSKHQS